MTSMQFAVCGFLFWPFTMVIIALTRKSLNFKILQITFGGVLTGLIGYGLGFLWNL